MFLFLMRGLFTWTPARMAHHTLMLWQLIGTSPWNKQFIFIYSKFSCLYIINTLGYQKFAIWQVTVPRVVCSNFWHSVICYLYRFLQEKKRAQTKNEEVRAGCVKLGHTSLSYWPLKVGRQYAKRQEPPGCPLWWTAASWISDFYTHSWIKFLVKKICCS